MSYTIVLTEPRTLRPGNRLILATEAAWGWTAPRTAKITSTRDEGNGWWLVCVEKPANEPCPETFSFPASRLVLVAVRDTSGDHTW
jgi:hypothetical protein